MWSNEKRSRLMLIKFRIKKGFGFIFPVPLFILEDIVNSFSDLLYLADKVVMSSQKLSLGTIAALTQDLINELICYGRWEMVDIDVEEVRVSIEFY